MWALFATPLGRKIGASLAITLVVGLALRWYGNAQWSAGQEAGKASMSADLTKQVDGAVKVERARLQAERDRIAGERASLQADRAQLVRDRQNLDGQVREQLLSIEESLKHESTRIIETPDSGLADLVRALNAELRAKPRSSGAEGDSNKPP